MSSHQYFGRLDAKAWNGCGRVIRGLQAEVVIVVSVPVDDIVVAIARILAGIVLLDREGEHREHGITEELAQRALVAPMGSARGLDVSLGIDVIPCDVIAEVIGQLPDESALRSAVPFAKGMNRVDLGEVVGEAIHDDVAFEPLEIVLLRQAVQDVGEIGLDVLRKCEEAVAPADRDRPDLAGPRVDVLEDPTVDLLEMVDVVAAHDRVDGQPGQTDSGELSFTLRKLTAFADAPTISENRGPGIDVRVVVDNGGLGRGKQIVDGFACEQTALDALQLRVGDLALRPEAEDRFGATSVESFEANGRQRIGGRFFTRCHHPDCMAAQVPRRREPRWASLGQRWSAQVIRHLLPQRWKRARAASDILPPPIPRAPGRSFGQDCRNPPNPPLCYRCPRPSSGSAGD